MPTWDLETNDEGVRYGKFIDGTTVWSAKGNLYVDFRGTMAEILKSSEIKCVGIPLQVIEHVFTPAADDHDDECDGNGRIESYSCDGCPRCKPNATIEQG